MENTVIRNAAVLPVPVWACPATSFPVKEIGRVLACIGVQCANPASRIPCKTGSGIGRDSKVICFKRNSGSWGALGFQNLSYKVVSGGVSNRFSDVSSCFLIIIKAHPAIATVNLIFLDNYRSIMVQCSLILLLFSNSLTRILP